MKAAEEIYGGKVLKLNYGPEDLSKTLSKCSEVYEEKTCQYVERVFQHQMDKYRDFFFTKERESWKNILLTLTEKESGIQLIGKDDGHEFVVSPKGNNDIRMGVVPSGETNIHGLSRANVVYEFYTKYGPEMFNVFKSLSRNAAHLSRVSFQEFSKTNSEKIQNKIETEIHKEEKNLYTTER